MDFSVHPYRKNSKCCSKKCAIVYQDKGSRRKGECVICTTRYISYNKDAKYCSVKCRAIANTGDNHFRWAGGSWLSIRKQVLVLQDYTCQVCGLKDTEIMQVNHKLPKSKYPELAKCLDNLETLCPNCHARKSLVSIKKKWSQ